ncbi:tescalcin a [Syngnathus scovelli]|uniref:tescalcin a n=1 Tax=Syngnathus scovelli TaxID=161590 RepID=UPI00210F3B3A|nr:tescalcin a [Syngnathus scovelli]
MGSWLMRPERQQQLELEQRHGQQQQDQSHGQQQQLDQSHLQQQQQEQQQQEQRQRYEELAHKSGFSRKQIKTLHKRFRHLSGNKEMMRREHLDAIPQLSHNPIKKQIIDAFFDKRNQHQGMVGSYEEITLDQFLMVMSHFRPLAHISRGEERQAASKQKLRLLFNMHDKDSDGIITLAEYRKVVEELLCKSGDFGDQVAKAIARAAMLEAADKALDDFYEGITFEMFQLMLKALELESRMHIRF